jgi:hypothetical protein
MSNLKPREATVRGRLRNTGLSERELLHEAGTLAQAFDHRQAIQSYESAIERHLDRFARHNLGTC